MKRDLFNVLEKMLVVVIPALAILGLAVTLVLGSYSLALLSIYLAVPMLLATMAYKLFFKDIASDKSLPDATLAGSR
jgi:hypothetical protein